MIFKLKLTPFISFKSKIKFKITFKVNLRHTFNQNTIKQADTCLFNVFSQLIKETMLLNQFMS